MLAQSNQYSVDDFVAIVAETVWQSDKDDWVLHLYGPDSDKQRALLFQYERESERAEFYTECVEHIFNALVAIDYECMCTIFQHAWYVVSEGLDFAIDKYKATDAPTIKLFENISRRSNLASRRGADMFVLLTSDEYLFACGRVT